MALAAVLLFSMGLPLRTAVSLGLMGSLALVLALKLLRASVWLAMMVVGGILLYGFIVSRRDRGPR